MDQRKKLRNVEWVLIGEPEVSDNLFLLLFLDGDLLVILIMHHRLLVIVNVTTIILIFLSMHLLVLHFSTG